MGARRLPPFVTLPGTWQPLSRASAREVEPAFPLPLMGERQMRQIIVTEFISADAFADVDKLRSVTWNSEMDQFKNEELSDSGAMLLGARPIRSLPAIGPRKPETSLRGSMHCQNTLHRRH